MRRIAPPLLLLCCACAGAPAPHPPESSVSAPAVATPPPSEAKSDAMPKVKEGAKVRAAAAEPESAPALAPVSPPAEKTVRPAAPSAVARAAVATKPAAATAGVADLLSAGAGGGPAGGGGLPAPKPGVAPPVAPVRAPRPPRDESPPQSVGLKAGSADDNLSFSAFVEFVAKSGHGALRDDVSERVIVAVTDRDGRTLPDARVTVQVGGKVVLERRTYADGRAMIFPSEDPLTLHAADAVLRVEAGQKSHSEPLNCDQCGRVRNVRLDVVRALPQLVPLDVAIVLDTTGSMGGEIEQLRKTIEVIHFQLTHLQPAVDVRFGMVLYKDQTDEERTRVIPFTRDLDAFRDVLQTLRAGGGGDEPEDVQAGLDDALHKLDWRADGVKVGFLIGDAAPHLDYGQSYTYVSAMKDAARRAIKLATIGCSGLPLRGEVVWRQLAQYTMGPYVFLSRGEKGDAEGSPSSVSHHVGSNWVAENLDAIIVRLVKTELAFLQARAPQRETDYFEAQRPSQGDGEAVLQDLFRQAVKQLVDYSLEPLAEKTPTLLVPLSVKEEKLKPAATRLEGRLQLGLLGTRRFALIDEKATPELLRVMEAQLSENYDSEKVVAAGRLVPAQLLVLGQLVQTASGPVEMMVKLVRLKTGELLSLSLLKIDPALLR